MIFSCVLIGHCDKFRLGIAKGNSEALYKLNCSNITVYF